MSTTVNSAVISEVNQVNIPSVVDTIRALINEQSITLDGTVKPSALTLDVMRILCAINIEAVKNMQASLRKSNVMIDLHDSEIHHLGTVAVCIKFSDKISPLFRDPASMHATAKGNTMFHFMPFIPQKFKDSTPCQFYALSEGFPYERDSSYCFAPTACRNNLLSSAVHKLKLFKSLLNPRGYDHSQHYEAIRLLGENPEIAATIEEELRRPDLFICEQGSGYNGDQEAYRAMDDCGFAVSGDWDDLQRGPSKQFKVISRMPINEFLNVNVDELDSLFDLERQLEIFAEKRELSKAEGFVAPSSITLDYHQQFSVTGHAAACFAQELIVKKQQMLPSEFLRWYFSEGCLYKIVVTPRHINSRSKRYRYKRMMPEIEYYVSALGEWQSTPPANPYKGKRPGQTFLDIDGHTEHTVPLDYEE